MAKTIPVKFKSEFDAASIQNFVSTISRQLESISISEVIKKDINRNLSDIGKALNKVISFDFKSKDVGGFKQIAEALDYEIENLQRKLLSISEQNLIIKVDNAQLIAINDEIATMQKRLEILKSSDAFGGLLKQSGLSTSIQRAITDLDGLQSYLNRLETELANIKITDFISPFAMQQYKEYLSDLNITKAKIEEINNIIKKANAENASNKAKTAMAQEAGYINYTAMQDQLNAMKSAEKIYDIAIQKEQQKKAEIQSTILILKQVNEAAGILPKEIEKSELALQQLQDRYVEVEKDLSQIELKNQAPKLDAMKTAASNTKNAMRDLADETVRYQVEVEKAIGKELSNKVTAFAIRWFGVEQALRAVTRQAKLAWETYKDLDTQVTGIAMVTGQSLSGTWGQVGNYTSLARELGITTRDVAKQAEEFYRQGREGAEVIEIIRGTTKMAAIANMDYGVAVEYMTAALNGFKLAGEDAIMVSDMFSKLDASAAVSVNDLAIALSKTASIAKSAGMEIETTSAFLTKMIETTQEAPENLGTAMKSIIARMQELKESPLVLTEEGIDANKVEAALRTAGVALRDTVGEFRDLDDVLLELGSKWESLDRNTQRYIATMVAGNRQQSRFIALMDDYKRTLDLVDIANNAAGTSTVAFQKRLDNMNTAINKIKVSWEAFYLSGDMVELFTKGANAAGELIQTFADFGTVGTLSIAVLSFLALKIGLTAAATGLATIATKGLTGEQYKAATASIVQQQGLAGLISKLFASKIATDQLSTSARILQSTFLPLAAIAGVVTLFGLIVAASTEAERSIRKFRDELQELESVSVEQERNLQDLSNLINKYSELSAAENLNVEQKEELAAISNELARISPQLVDSYDEEGNAILRNEKYLRQYIALQTRQAALTNLEFRKKQIEGYLNQNDEMADAIIQLTEEQQRLNKEQREYIGLLEETVNVGGRPGSEKTFYFTKEALTEAKGYMGKPSIGMRGAIPKEEIYANAMEASGEAAKSYQDYLAGQEKEIELLNRTHLENTKQIINNANKDIVNLLVSSESLRGNELDELGQTTLAEMVNKFYSDQIEGLDSDQMNQFLKNFLATDNAELASQIQHIFLDLFILTETELKNFSNLLLNTDNLSLDDFAVQLNYELQNSLSGLPDYFKQVLQDKQVQMTKAFQESITILVEQTDLDPAVIENFGDKVVSLLVKKFESIEGDATTKGRLASSYHKLVQDSIRMAASKGISVDEIYTTLGQIDFTTVDGIVSVQLALSDLLGVVPTEPVFSKMFDGVAEVAQATTMGMEEIADRVDYAQKHIKDFQDLLGSAAAGSMTGEEAKTLFNLVPDLGPSDLKGTADGIGIVTKSVYELADSYRDAQRAKFEAYQDRNQSVLDRELAETGKQSVAEAIKYYDTLIEASAQSGAFADSQVEKWEAARVAIIDAADGVEIFRTLAANFPEFNPVDLAWMQSLDAIDVFSEKVSVAIDAIAEFTDTQQISYKTAQDLVNANLGFGAAIEEVNGVLVINKDLLEQIIREEEKSAKAKSANALADIATEKAKVQLRIASLNQIITLLSAEENAQRNNSEAINEILRNDAILAEALDKAVDDSGRLTQENLVNYVGKSTGETGNFLIQSVNNYGAWGEQVGSIINSVIQAHEAAANAAAGTSFEQVDIAPVDTSKIDKSFKDIEISAGNAAQSINDVYQKLTEDSTPASIEAANKELLNWAENQKKAMERQLADITGIEASIGAIQETDWTGKFAGLDEALAPAKAGKEVDELAEKIKALNQQLDDYQSSLELLSKAVEEYEVNGHIAIDTLQSILALGPQYLSYLTDSEGNLQLNTEAIYKLTAAQIEELALEEALQLVGRIREAQQKNEIDLILKMATATGIAANTTWQLVYSQLAELNLSESLNASFVKQIQNMQRLSDLAIRGIGKETISREESERRREKAAKDREKLEQEAQKAAEKAAKEREDLEKKRAQLIDKMENALLKALMDRDKKEIDNLKAKYDKMKALDISYLDALKKMREKEKQMKEDKKDLDDLQKLKNRLALLERDTSGVYAKEIMELSAQVREKEEDLSEKKKDAIINDLEDELDKTHSVYDKEVKALEDANDAKKENMQLYWTEVQAIMDQGVDAMLATLTEYHNDFQDLSARQKEAWIRDMTEAGNAVIGIMERVKSVSDSMYEGFDMDLSQGSGYQYKEYSSISDKKTSSSAKTSSSTASAASTASKTANFSGPIYTSQSGASNEKGGVNPLYGSGPYEILSTSNGVAKVRKKGLSSGVTGYFPLSKRYLKGGLADYTGPAWVDGTKSNPEAFLSADDTRLMRQFLDSLRTPKNKLGDIYSTRSNTPDTVGSNLAQKIVLDIHVDNIYDERGIDLTIDRVKEELAKVGINKNTIIVRRS